jgi:site-specific DNA-methyltransferase (adenine-specific)
MTVIHGDCLDVMPTLDAESVDAIVTDPPYGLGFMGKAWDSAAALASRPPSADRAASEGRDPYPRTGKGPAAVAFDGRGYQSWCQEWAAAALRVAKPGAYLLSFGGTRTVHRLACAIEDAGWIIRDMLVWGYASGFPKGRANLKPAWEPIVMARKPGPLRMLAIDECRIGFTDEWDRIAAFPGGRVTSANPGQPQTGERREVDTAQSPLGRWPANVVLTDPIFDGGWDGVVGGGDAVGAVSNGKRLGNGYGEGYGAMLQEPGYGDSGTYSRFFLISKAARSDREPVLGGLVPRREMAHRKTGAMDTPYLRGETFRQNAHPTVKPTDLMRHLVRLVTPTGGTVLDPFLGSGTTALAAEMEGFAWVGIEKEAEYVAIAEARLNGTQRGMAL